MPDSLKATRARENTMNISSPFRRFLSGISLLIAALLLGLPGHAQRAERSTLDITGYKIDAEIDTQAHHLQAKAAVTFTAPENAEVVSFGFHPALKVTKITDQSGKTLTGERSADG